MATQQVRIGHVVEVAWLSREGTVVEIDRERRSARVVLFSDEAEHWVGLDDLDVVIPRMREKVMR